MKKRSAAKPREKFVFFIDRSLGRYDVPQVLRAAGYVCERHDDHWDQETEDSVWLAGKNWVVLTKENASDIVPRN